MSEKTDDIIAEMNEYYRMRAPDHDSAMGYSNNEAMEKLLGPIIRCVEDFIRNRDVLEIACGTGNWTQVLSKRARTVIATDINDNVIDLALRKPFTNNNVTFKVSDAYSLENIKGSFNAAFAADWLSHVPKSMIPVFLDVLHSKLQPGANVVFIDMSPNEYFENESSFYDEDNNRVSIRNVSGGKRMNVIKNFPDKEELINYVIGKANSISYHEDILLLRWVLKYKVK